MNRTTKRKHTSATQDPVKDARARLRYDALFIEQPELREGLTTNWSAQDPTDTICHALVRDLGREDTLGGPVDFKHRTFFRRCVRDRKGGPAALRASRAADIKTVRAWAELGHLDLDAVQRYYGLGRSVTYDDGPLDGVDPLTEPGSTAAGSRAGKSTVGPTCACRTFYQR